MARGGSRYRPVTSNRFYPGRIDEERKRALRNWEVEIDDFTADDILYMNWRRFIGTLHGVYEVMRDRWGEEAARDVLVEFGRRRGRAAYASFLEANGAKRGTPELMAKFQDYGHFLGGPEFSTAFNEYEGNVCVSRRTTCGWNDPDADVSLCAFAGQGHVIGYHEADPALVSSDKPVCLAFGDDRCERTFVYNPRARKPTAPPPLREPRRRRRRG